MLRPRLTSASLLTFLLATMLMASSASGQPTLAEDELASRVRALIEKHEAVQAFQAVVAADSADPILLGEVFAALGQSDMAVATYAEARRDPEAVDRMGALLRTLPADTALHWFEKMRWDIEDWRSVAAPHRWLLLPAVDAREELLPLYLSIKEELPFDEELELFVARTLLNYGTYWEEDMRENISPSEQPLVEAGLEILTSRTWSPSHGADVAYLLTYASAYLERLPAALEELRKLAERGDESGVIRFLMATTSSVPQSCHGMKCSLPPRPEELRLLAELAYRRFCRTGHATMGGARQEAPALRAELDPLWPTGEKAWTSAAQLRPENWQGSTAARALGSARRLLDAGKLQRLARRFDRIEAALQALEPESDTYLLEHQQDTYLYYFGEKAEIGREAGLLAGNARRKLVKSALEPVRFPELYPYQRELPLALDTEVCDERSTPPTLAKVPAAIHPAHGQGCAGCTSGGSSTDSWLLFPLMAVLLMHRRRNSMRLTASL